MEGRKGTHRILVEPQPDALGGGWSLRLLEGETEVGGGVFPLGEYWLSTTQEKEARRLAPEDTMQEAWSWLETITVRA